MCRNVSTGPIHGSPSNASGEMNGEASGQTAPATAIVQPAVVGSTAVGVANLDVFEQEDVVENVAAHEAGFRDRLEQLCDLPIVGDVRGAGYFQALEMVPDPGSDARFNAEEREELLRGFPIPPGTRLG